MKHTYRWFNGLLEHFVDGDLRATVAEPNVAAYAESAGLDPATIPASSQASAGERLAWLPNGKLEHRVDGNLRATIEAKDIDVYLAATGLSRSLVGPALTPSPPGIEGYPTDADRFTWNASGQLEHRTNGVLRDTIERQDVDAYLKNAGIDPATVPHYSPAQESVAQKTKQKA